MFGSHTSWKAEHEQKQYRYRYLSARLTLERCPKEKDAMSVRRKGSRGLRPNNTLAETVCVTL